MNDHDRPCGSNCGHIVMERNRYFTGKFMTPRDMRADTDYLLSRLHTHNRLLHGWGVLCGLNVVKHPTAECDEKYVIVKPGAAIDCCGREIYISEDQYVSIDPEVCKDDTFLLFVKYHEDRVEEVPALYDDHTGETTRTQPNRFRERPEFVCLPNEAPWTEYWNIPGDLDPVRCVNDCDDPQPGPAGTCLEPDCLPREKPTSMVVLALITRRGERAPIIDLRGRREFPVPTRFLTHVVQTNWPHGGTVTMDQIQAWDGELRVTFDRRLEASSGDTSTGISEFTFLVEHYEPEEDYDVEVAVPDDEEDDPIRVETPEDGCSVAVYRLHRRYLRGRHQLAGHRVRITLKCDFILDCHGNPVDGNHLRGRLPSGDGVAGGTFESWFTVVDGSEKSRQESSAR